MTKTEKEKQLVSARKACLLLAPFAVGKLSMAVLTDEARECVADLLEQFGRLDKAERNRNSKAGRPKKWNSDAERYAFHNANRKKKSKSKTEND